MDTLQLSLRDARDRLIDFLGVGNTFPLPDVILQKDSLKVPFSTDKQPSMAKIIFTYWQRDVRYQLCDQDGKPLGEAIDGDHDDLQLVSPPIKENRTFKILATKTKTGKSQFLRSIVDVKVGLDTSLKANIDAPLLDPKVDQPAFDAPRLVDFDTAVRVNIIDCQEGVEYKLVYFGADNKEIARSPASILNKNLGDDIVLVSETMKQDVAIRILATKTFDPADNKANDSEFLLAVLPLKVRANPALAVAVDAVVDFNGKAEVAIEGAEETVSYQVYVHAIPDRDFIHGALLPDLPVLKVTLPDKATIPPDNKTVTIRRPPRAAVWQLPPGFDKAGTPQQGNKDKLTFPLSELKSDTIIIVQATKDHGVGTSSIQLAQAVAVLVRPNSSLPKLNAKLDGDALLSPIQVTGGQPSVFYAFSDANAKSPGNSLGNPVYFHQLNPDDPKQNKGIEQLQIEVDFVVLNDFTKPVTVPPQPPVLDVKTLSANTTLSLQAIKAQTRVTITLGPVTAKELLDTSG